MKRGTDFPNMERSSDAASAGASELKSMLSITHSCYGMVDGFAGETRYWDEDYVMVVFKIKKDDAMAIRDCAVVKLQW